MRDWPCQVITTSASGPPAYPDPWPFAAPHSIRGIRGHLTGRPPTFGQSAGAWGCWRSHCRLWEDMLNHPHPGIVIFEEDVIFRDWSAVPAFLAAVPADWDMIYLGGQHLAPPETTATPGILRGININRTHAYILKNNARTQAAYWRLCDMRTGQAAGGHIDYLLGDLMRRKQLTANAPVKWFCGQGAGTGRSTTSGALTGGERWWDQCLSK